MCSVAAVHHLVIPAETRLPILCRVGLIHGTVDLVGSFSPFVCMDRKRTYSILLLESIIQEKTRGKSTRTVLLLL